MTEVEKRTFSTLALSVVKWLEELGEKVQKEGLVTEKE
jgi:hypothetical protein